MAKMQRMLVLAVLMPIRATGCVTVNLFEPPGPCRKCSSAGSGDSKVLLLDLSGVISSQEKEGLLPQPNLLATFKGADQGVEGRQGEGVRPAHQQPRRDRQCVGHSVSRAQDVQSQQENSRHCVDDGWRRPAATTWPWQPTPFWCIRRPSPVASA